jgi:hypothetical protein
MINYPRFGAWITALCFYSSLRELRPERQEFAYGSAAPASLFLPIVLGVLRVLCTKNNPTPNPIHIPARERDVLKTASLPPSFTEAWKENVVPST